MIFETELLYGLCMAYVRLMYVEMLLSVILCEGGTGGKCWEYLHCLFTEDNSPEKLQ